MLEHQFPAKITIISQDKHKTKQLAEALGNRSFAVQIIATNLQEFTNTESYSTDLFIIDIHSYDTNGAEICRKIRHSTQMPIFVLSSFDQPGMVEHILDAGADEFMLKPVPMTILIARIRTLMRRAKTETSARLMHLKASGYITA